MRIAHCICFSSAQVHTVPQVEKHWTTVEHWHNCKKSSLWASVMNNLQAMKIIFHGAIKKKAYCIKPKLKSKPLELWSYSWKQAALKRKNKTRIWIFREKVRNKCDSRNQSLMTGLKRRFQIKSRCQDLTGGSKPISDGWFSSRKTPSYTC